MKLRLVTPADAGEIAAIYAPIVRDTFISFEVDPPDAAEMRRRIDKALPEFPWLVCERDGHVAGYAYASRHRDRLAYQWSVDVSCYVHPEARGRGIGRALYVALLRILRSQGFQSAYAGIALPNPGSVALHESVGFRRVATYTNVGYKQGRWLDTGWWEAALGDPLPGPAAPRPLTSLGPGILDDP
jgi:phosphinothricin acetyltransferase